MLSTIKTPCIGVCSTGIGDSVCRGCKRFAHEVINWNGYSEAERSSILSRIESLLTQVVQERLEVVDVDALKHSLLEQKVRCNLDMNRYYLAYEAIRTFGNTLPGLDAIGCELKSDWRTCSIQQFKSAVDEAFYELSCAHYQRYFPGHM